MVDGRVVHCVVDWAVQGRVADTQVTLQPLVIIVGSIVHLLEHKEDDKAQFCDLLKSPLN